jgi:two-component system phosphate regulon sensor histidine kinase PhoR
VLAWAAFLRFRRLWRQLNEIVADLAEGRRPVTFVFSWSNSFARLGARLEEIAGEMARLRRRIEEDEFNRQAILSGMAEGLAVVDARRVIRLVNDSFRHLFSLKGDPVGQTMLAAIREPAVEQMIEAALRGPGPQHREIPVIQAGKAKRFLSVNAVGTRDASGAAAGAVVVFHDITGLRQLDEIRREFVANVSHELRTPLAIFQGYVETLLEDPSLGRAEIDSILLILQRHSKRLNALVEDLLTLARLDSARIRLSLSPVSVGEIADAIGADWSGQFASRGLRLEIAAEPGIPPLLADRMRLEQVLHNLIDNAAKHSPSGGAVAVAIAREADAVRIEISDNGTGIPAADLPFIFDRFYRVEKDRSRDTGGTGLGLSIVKRIVEMHGGRVEAASKPGLGTTIRILLPLAGPEEIGQIGSTPGPASAIPS